MGLGLVRGLLYGQCVAGAAGVAVASAWFIPTRLKIMVTCQILLCLRQLLRVNVAYILLTVCRFCS